MNIFFLDRLLAKFGRSNPVRLLVLGYGAYILLAWLLLCLPISWQNGYISPLDNLFIAASAVSTTGLVTVNTPEAYNFFGELVVLLAFQLGGLGYMTLGSFVLIASKNSLSSFRRQVGSTVFSLPEGFNLKTFLRHTVIFTLITEFFGAVILDYLFERAGVENHLWAGIFHFLSSSYSGSLSWFIWIDDL